MFQNFKFDPPSFLIGLVSGLLIWFIATMLKSAFPHIREMMKANLKKIQDTNTGGAARYIRLFVQKKSQKSHLAFPLFALDEVVIPPRFLVSVNTDGLSNNSIGESCIPDIYTYSPSWPELPSQYNWPSLSAEEILQNGANLAIIGQPGSGKSVALAYLASKIARKDPSTGSLAEFTPLLVQVNELDNIDTAKDLFEEIIRLYARQAPLFVKSRVASYLTAQVKSGNVILFLDGLDELDAADLSNVTKLIAADLKLYPGFRLMAAASPDYLDGLLNIGIQPLSLASWDLNERIHFADQWGKKWGEYIVPQIKKHTPNYVDSQLFIESWISLAPPYLTPLDWTLKIWSIYSGDSFGVTTLNSLDSYIYRTSNEILSQDALANLALLCNRSEKGIISHSQVEAILSSQNYSLPMRTEYSSTTQPNESTADSQANSPFKKADKKSTFSGRIISQLVANGILSPVGENSFSFIHPIISAYLASLAFNKDPSELITQKNNPRDEHLIHFLAAQNKAGSALDNLIVKSEPPFYVELLKVCAWLKDTSPGLEWRSHLMRQIIKLFMQPDLPIGMRPSIVAALVISNDPGVSTLFRQLLTSPEEEIRVLAALACGALQDTKSIHEIALLMEDQCLNVQLAACLAVGIIKTPVALTYISNTFLEGDETLKQVAAEVLAYSGEEGYQLLKEGYESDNLVLRRAVVFGLKNVKQQWAREMLENIAVRDAQWVVRNAAAQALETFNSLSPYIPSKLPAPAQAPWLIAFAARQGVGVPPDKVPIDMLFSTLAIGTQEERIAALTYLRLIPNDEVIRKIYSIATSEQGAIKDAALLSLWYLRISGARLSVIR
jgi:hypothetical protein